TQYPYNMTDFRQALAYSINGSAIVQQSEFGYGVSANNAQGEVPQSQSWYNPNQMQYPYNVSKALSLLHQIGFTGGGSPSTPLKFPNGTAMSTTIYTDTNKAWDPDVAQQVAGFFEQLGISVQTQTLTSQNLGADYASNAFNMRSNLVIYSSGGPYYFSPWIDAQQGCNIMGTPGCYGWQATPASDGQTHWLYPPSADVQYQGNLTGINNTPLTNNTGEKYYLDNIESLNAQYLPVIMLSYPDEIFAYNTAHWTSWPSYYFITGGQFNLTMFGALTSAGSGSSTTTTTSSVGVSQTTSTSQTGTGSNHVTTTTSLTGQSSSAQTTSTTSTSSNIGTIELIAGIVIVIIIIGGIAAYVMRRRP
ncbi:MAG: ABC transporter substrate-binding protein, partial [Nitrososphaerales archaeon]